MKAAGLVAAAVAVSVQLVSALPTASEELGQAGAESTDVASVNSNANNNNANNANNNGVNDANGNANNGNNNNNNNNNGVVNGNNGNINTGNVNNPNRNANNGVGNNLIKKGKNKGKKACKKNKNRVGAVKKNRGKNRNGRTRNRNGKKRNRNGKKRNRKGKKRNRKGKKQHGKRVARSIDDSIDDELVARYLDRRDAFEAFDGVAKFLKERDEDHVVITRAEQTDDDESLSQRSVDDIAEDIAVLEARDLEDGDELQARDVGIEEVEELQARDDGAEDFGGLETRDVEAGDDAAVNSFEERQDDVTDLISRDEEAPVAERRDIPAERVSDIVARAFHDNFVRVAVPTGEQVEAY